MAVEIDSKTYRNLPEQVEENANNIQRLLDIISSFGNVMRYCGSVATYDDLPTEDNQIGDVWNVLDTGNNYAWDGEGWDEISSIVDLSGYVAIIQTDGIDDESAYVGAKVGDVVVDSAGFVGVIKRLEKTGNTINLITISGLEDNNVPTTYVGYNGSWSSSSMNYVTPDTAQAITGIKAFTEIDIANTTTHLLADGNNKGEIGQPNNNFKFYDDNIRVNTPTLRPQTDGTTALGVSNIRFSAVHASTIHNDYSSLTIYANGFVNVNFTGNDRALRPSQDNAHDLGGTSNGWRDAYIKRYLTDGTNSVTVADLVWKEIPLANISSVSSYQLIPQELYKVTIIFASGSIPATAKEIIVEGSTFGVMHAYHISISTNYISILTTVDFQQSEIEYIRYR